MFSAEITNQLVIASGLIAATFLVHAIFVALISAFLRGRQPTTRGIRDLFRDVIIMVAISVLLLIAHFSSIWMWAICYLHLGAFIDLETALYFSAASYTTLGYGDVLPPQEWRILAGAMAANGLLLFGLSAAILVDASVRIRLGGDS
ncbi:MAG: potassium channel family protein [Aquisalinus sp.]|nr:potassium channel family protein [Aquisalinus sp.]